MANRRRNLFVLLFVAGLIFASLAVIATKKTVLGLDLRGGTELIYQGRPTPQTPEVTGQDIDRSIEIIRERTDKLGVAEPEISRIGQDSIRVGLPDVSNADRAIQQVGTTAQLFFYDWEPNVIGKPGAQDPAEQGFPRLYDAVLLASEQKPSCDNCTTGTQYYLFGKQSLQLIAGPEEVEADLFANQPGGVQPPNSSVITVPQGVIVVEDQPPPDNPDTSENEAETAPPEYFVLKDRPELSGTDIKNPEQNYDPDTNQPNVTFDFTDSGRGKFQDVTRRIAQRGLANSLPGSDSASQSDHFAVVLDQDVKSRPIIDYQENPDGIDGRTGAQISGLELGEAQTLANFIRIGALPIKLQLISQSTVSASLGQQALDQGLKAGIIGLILVLLFMLLYYRFLGFVAGIGLLIYAVFFFALIKLIPITLTLPGIAGLVLTIGVAADSNIVIFERIREEVRAGKSIPSAIATGYRKGIATIVDANVITLITAFILFVLATAGVKGFAFVLGVGTIVSLFTAVVFTQAFLGLFGRAKFMRSPSFIGAGEQRVRWHFDFMGASKYFFSMSGIILLVGAIALATLQLNRGIDFKSGTRIQVAIDKPASVDQIRTTVSGAGVGADAKIQSVKDPQLGENVFQIQTETLAPDKVGEVQTALDNEFGVVENGFDNQSIGPTFGKQIARSAAYAIIFSLLVICAYVAFRFEPKYAVPVLIALFHDVLITAGVYSLAGREVTSGTIAAFLTILGYSMYDTIIVFDRIRENVPRLPRAAFSQIVNRSMSEVLTRSLITGLSTVFLVTVLLIFGGATLKDFAFAMMVGIASGTYSSIFIASPVLTAWKEREPAYRSRRARIIERMGYLPPFPEENVVARVEDAPEGQETPVDDVEAPTGPAPTPPAPQPAAPVQGPPEPSPAPSRDTLGQPVAAPPPPPPAQPAPETPAGDGEGAGDEAVPAKQPELSEASAAALQRMREQREGKGGRGRRKKKHGRPR
ncbi:MAG: protein translocase subunit SecD [Solirubrobacterales bacterium]